MLFAFEGIDGSGKSTQARLFAEWLRAEGVVGELVEVREPGGTSLGETVRSIVLDPATRELDVRAELFLFMAARAQLCAEVIAPALERGASVVADRYFWSSMVYQGIAGGLGIDDVRAIARVATQGIAPRLTFVIDLDPKVAAARLGSVRDRIERRGVEFASRVRDGYLELARRYPDEIVVIDGEGDPRTVHDRVLRVWESERSGS